MKKRFSQRELRDAFGTFATGVTVITAVRPEGDPVGTTANSFTSVSLDPPLLLWCLANSSASAAAFALGREFAVHVLAHDQRDLATHFARRLREKFEVDHHWRSNPHPPHLAGAVCRFDCKVHAQHEAGDHLIVMGEVIGIERHVGEPLVFQGGRFGGFSIDRGAPHVDFWESWRGEWL